MTYVIIGAGPAGLYTAIKLRKAGIRDVVVFDQRAGNYTRPGHLSPNVFVKAGEGIRKKIWPTGQAGHIKDLERGLYKEAIALGIKIEKKRFIGMYKDVLMPGVIIKNKEGVEEIVKADYVFDCTGTRREVISAVNRIDSNSPLQLTTITELPVTHHFIAYVKSTFRVPGPLVVKNTDALSFARAISKLHSLGWKELEIPRCYGVPPSSKEKICFYFHTPHDLSKESYDKWVKTVLECYDPAIRYERFPDSEKPRFGSFTLGAQALNAVSYRGNNLPTVIGLGDAQIDFNYELGHGISDGMDRIDALFEHMEIVNGEIYYFDSQDYMDSMHEQLRSHKNAIIRAAERLQLSFADALESAPTKLREAISLTTDQNEKKEFEAILVEVEARLSYKMASKMFAECHNKSNQLNLTGSNLNQLATKLGQIHRDLLKAYADLTPSFPKELRETENLLNHLAVSWKEIGNAQFKKGQSAQAIESYKNALEIYKLSPFQGKSTSKELPLYSNLTIAYMSEKKYSEASEIASTALSLYEQCPENECPAALLEKIIFNYIKGLCARGQEISVKNKSESANLLSKAKELLETHGSKLVTQREAASKIIAEFANSCSTMTNLSIFKGAPSNVVNEATSQNLKRM